MPPAIRGPLVSPAFAAAALWQRFAGRLGEPRAQEATARLARWWARAEAALGPASSLRGLFDHGAAPLCGLLGYRVGAAALLGPDLLAAQLAGPGPQALGLLVALYADDLDRVWRAAVRLGLAADWPWCLAFNGRALRLIDTRRTYARRFLEFDLAETAQDDGAGRLLWALLRAEATVPRTAGAGLLDAVAAASDAYRAAVGAALSRGVAHALRSLLEGLLEALARERRRARPAVPLTGLFDHALTLVYRLLFLLFAEARGLVPIWHPLYRRAYSLDALRANLDAPATARGSWETLQAISRLAARGCQAGELRVTPFNGRLFAPTRAPLLDRLSLDDGTAREVLRALTSRPAGAAGREPLAYSELGVEQLGAVYERVLDLTPRLAAASPRPRVRLDEARDRRKATGSFYTPRSITDYLVRRTLHPLVDGARADEILRVRILDPAMGSGAFLVAACRYLAAAYEAALVREGEVAPTDLDETDRATFRRLVAQRCLYGVDLNPDAVHLARLSLWLATLAADRPLTFLDHHLRVGDSLIGASVDQVARRPPPNRRRRSQPLRPLPLFAGVGLDEALADAVPCRVQIAAEPDDTLDTVRRKERTLARLEAPHSALARWKAVLDLWCAYWFWEPATAPPATAFADLAGLLLGEQPSLPDRIARGYLARARALAQARRWFHWTLEFPEVFYGPDGRPHAASGFDAIVGNPPWEMLRGDTGDARTRRRAHADATALRRFALESGLARAPADGHQNVYHLFLERALGLLRPGGRLGFVLPWGLAADHGAAALRRRLFEETALDALVSLDNRDGIFPIHRSVRFLLLTATAGRPTTAFRCRLGERDPAVLDAVPDGPAAGTAAFPLTLTRAIVERLSGADLAIPDLRTPRDRDLATRLAGAIPPLADPAGWGARFGRELNVTEDRAALVPPGQGLPVVGGKQIAPFCVDLERADVAIPEAVAAARLDRAATFDRPRVAYRDVASATNRLTLIAALIPARVVTMHTLYCLKTPLPLPAQQCLLALLNSYVANYLARLWVTTHVTVALVERLPVPRPPDGSAVFEELAVLASRLAERPREAPALAARLQALAAQLYTLEAAEFDHVLATFPLLAGEEKAAARAAFAALTAASPAGSQ